ncbi:unnamed protein product [Lampetra planeri]
MSATLPVGATRPPSAGDGLALQRLIKLGNSDYDDDKKLFGLTRSRTDRVGVLARDPTTAGVTAGSSVFAEGKKMQEGTVGKEGK